MNSARKQLADEMDRRRKELHIRWGEVARRAGMTPQNLLRIRNGDIALSDFAAAGINHALGWPAGYSEAIENGNEPPVGSPGYPAELYSKEERNLTEQEREILAVRGMSDEGKWNVIFGLREQHYDKRGSQNLRRQPG